MFCIKCGRELPEGSAFCPACGEAVSGAEQPPRAPGTDLDYMRNDPALDLDVYKRIYIQGYILDGIVSACIIVLCLLMEPVNLHPYAWEEPLNWPVIVGGLAALVAASAVVQMLFRKKAADRLLSDVELFGKRIMWKTHQSQKTYFEIIRTMDPGKPAASTIKEAILSTSAPASKYTALLVTGIIWKEIRPLGIVLQRCAKEIARDLGEA